jgi:hypothetical protein
MMLVTAGSLLCEEMSTMGGRNVEEELSIDEEKAVDAAAHEEFLMLVFEVGLAEMADSEVEKTFLERYCSTPSMTPVK